jgi:hypothetical protein
MQRAMHALLYRESSQALSKISKSQRKNVPYVTLAHVGRVPGQSKQIWLSLLALSLRNCTFLSAVGRQT